MRDIITYNCSHLLFQVFLLTEMFVIKHLICKDNFIKFCGISLSLLLERGIESLQNSKIEGLEGLLMGTIKELVVLLSGASPSLLVALVAISGLGVAYQCIRVIGRLVDKERDK